MIGIGISIRSQLLGGLFSPATLFSATSQEPGVWYDTSDLSTMFVDSAGVTAATVGQPVGLLLDKRLGLVRGAEIVSDSGFDSAAAWTLPAETSISGSALNFTATTATRQPTLNDGPTAGVVGKTYEVTFTVASISSGSVFIVYGGIVGTSRTAPGTYTQLMVATGINRPTPSAGTGTTASITSLSIKEVAGNHAAQATTAAKPVLRQHYEAVAVPAVELVTNGGFDSATGWTTAATTSIANGVGVFTASASGDNILQALPTTVVGRSYEVTYTVVSISAGSVSAAVGGNLGASRSTPGTYTETIVAAASNVYVRSRAAGTTATIDNISVKDANPAELVTNGTFDTNTTGWAGVNGSLSSVSGRLRITSTGLAFPYCYQIIPTVVGRTYLFSADGLTSPLSVKVGTGEGGSQFYLRTYVGGHSVGFVATTTTTYVTLTAENIANGAFVEFDNISLKEATAWRTVGAELVTNRNTASAVTGTPGALPTGWQASHPVFGLTRTIVAATSEYVDIRLAGTSTANYADFIGDFQAPPARTVAPGEYYEVNHTPVTVVAGAMPSGGVIQYPLIFQNNQNYVSQSPLITARHTALIPAGITDIRVPIVLGGYTTGTVIDVTLRVYAPSLKKVSDNVGYYLEFDGVDDRLVSTFAIAQPWDRVSALQQISWTSNDIFIGDAVNNVSGAVYQTTGTSGNIAIYDGAQAAVNTTMPIGANAIVIERHGGASSRLGVNNAAYTTGNPGANNPNGIAIGGYGGGTGQAGNIRFYGTVMRQAKVVAVPAVELVTNGGFDTDTAWTKSATAPATSVIAGGKLTLVSPAGEATNAIQNILTLGRSYVVTGNVTVRSGQVKVIAGTATEHYFSTSQSFTINVSNVTTNQLSLSRQTACDADFDNVSVKDANPTELVANGGFDSATGYTNISTGTGTATISGGQASLTGVDPSNRGRFEAASFATVAGRTYQITWQVVSGTASSQIVVNSGGTVFDRFAASVVGTNTGSFVAGAAVTSFSFNVYSAGTVVFDNFSIKEVESLTDAEITSIKNLQAAKAGVTLT